MNNKKSLFLKEKPVLALVNIHRNGKTYGSLISRDIDTTYAHTVNIINQLEKNGLITSKKEGRKRILQTTEEGALYASQFTVMMQDMGNQDLNLEDNSEEESSILTS